MKEIKKAEEYKELYDLYKNPEAMKFRSIIIIEDHSEIGGLNNIVKTAAYEDCYSGKIINFSLKDEFVHCYGNQDDLLDSHGISTNKIYKKISNNL